MSVPLESIAQLSTADPQVLEQVLTGLSSVGEEVLPHILESFHKTTENGTRINCLRAIGRVAHDNQYFDPKVLEAVLKIQEDICSADMNSRHRVYQLATVVKVLGMIGDTSVTKKLIGFLTHSDSRVRANAIEGLAFIIRRWSAPGDRDLTEALEAAIKDADVRVSVTATFALYLLHSVAAKNLKGRIDSLCHSNNEETKNAAVTAAASFNLKSESFFDLFTPDSIFALLRYSKSQGIY